MIAGPNKLAVCLVLILLFAFEVAAQPTCFVNFPVTDPCPLTNADLVFVARVMSLRKTDRDGKETGKEVDSLAGPVRGNAVVRVEALLKGEAPAQIELMLGRGCWGLIEQGKQYLFKVERRDGQLRSDQWSHPLDNSSPQEIAWALNRIRSIVRGAKQPRLFGRLLHSEKPVAHLTVVAEKDGRKFTTRTGADGRYAFWSLDDGEYQVYPLLPPWLRPPDGDDRLPRDKYENRSFINKVYSCGVHTDFVAWDNGVIAGYVEDADGNRVKPVVLTLQWLIDKNKQQSFNYPAQEVCCLGQGEFAYINLPPGPYNFFVTAEGAGGRHVYLYYPGAVEDEQQAKPINLARGQHLRNIVIKLPPL